MEFYNALLHVSTPCPDGENGHRRCRAVVGATSHGMREGRECAARHRIADSTSGEHRVAAAEGASRGENRPFSQNLFTKSQRTKKTPHILKMKMRVFATTLLAGMAAAVRLPFTVQQHPSTRCASAIMAMAPSFGDNAPVAPPPALALLLARLET